MENIIQYMHTNLIARDWKSLARFYIDTLNCTPVLPERDLSGDWIDCLTAIQGVRIRGMHLSLPGTSQVTLEILEYNHEEQLALEHKINRHGFSHIAFHVDSVEAVLKKVIENGGGQLGEIVIKEYEGLGLLTVVYASDPEGNFIELQNWKK